MTSVRLYGRTLGYGSHAQVTRGFQSALQTTGKLAGVVPLDQDPMPDEPEPEGALARSAVFTGPLGQIARMLRNARHERRYAVVAVNSSWVPSSLQKLLPETCTHLIAPSEWNASVLRRHFELPVTVAQHGVDPAFVPQPFLRDALRDSYRGGSFFVLHLSSSAGDRKGTRVLVEAWERLLAEKRLPGLARLDLVLDMPAHARLVEWLADRGTQPPANVHLRPRLDLPPAAMAQAYSFVHVVCQPSRGEGFGLTPLEARACGVPVCATACTGHADHVSGPGVVTVVHGPEAPIDDGRDAVAPSVSVEHVAAALEQAYDRWAELEQEAMEQAATIRREWSWSRRLAAFLDTL